MCAFHLRTEWLTCKSTGQLKSDLSLKWIVIRKQVICLIYSGHANKPRSLPANILQRNVGGFLVGLRFHDNCWVSVLELRKCIYKYFVSITKHTRIDHIHHTVFMRISALGTYLIFAIWNFRRGERGWGGGWRLSVSFLATRVGVY